MARSKKGKHRAESQPSDPQAHREAIETDRAASESLAAARERQSEVAKISSALRRIRERNHFGEMVRNALS